MVFYGPKSVNKEIFALELICRLVNPKNQEELTKRILGKNHPDVQIYSADDQEQYALSTIKTWVEEANSPPFELKQKWMMITDAKKLTSIHCNTLLKTLEEPNSQVHFILFVESLSDLMDTVNSRAIKIPFFPLSKGMMKQKIAEERSNLYLSLLQGSLDGLQLVKALDEKGFFIHLHQIFFSYLKKKPQEALFAFEEVDKALQEEEFSKKSVEIYSITFQFFLEIIKKMGEKNPKILRKVPDIFSIHEQLILAVKRYTKLRNCIERLAISIVSI